MANENEVRTGESGLTKAERLVQLREGYLDLKSGLIGQIEFGGAFAAHLKGFQEDGSLAEPSIKKALQALGGLGEKQPGIYLPLLGELRELYMKSKAGEDVQNGLVKTLELAEFVGMHKDLGPTGGAFHLISEYLSNLEPSVAPALDIGTTVKNIAELNEMYEGIEGISRSSDAQIIFEGRVDQLVRQVTGVQTPSEGERIIEEVLKLPDNFRSYLVSKMSGKLPTWLFESLKARLVEATPLRSGPEIPLEKTPDERWSEMKFELETRDSNKILEIQTELTGLRIALSKDRISKYDVDQLPDFIKEGIQVFLSNIEPIIKADPYRIGEISSTFAEENRHFLDNLLGLLPYGSYDSKIYHQGFVAPRHYKDFEDLAFMTSRPPVAVEIKEVAEPIYRVETELGQGTGLRRKVEAWGERDPSFKPPDQFKYFKELDAIDVFGKLGSGHTADVYLAQKEDTGEYLAIKYAKPNEDRIIYDEYDRLKQLESYQTRNGLLVNGEPISPKVLHRARGADTRFYLVMSFAEGIPLDEILKWGGSWVLPEQDSIEIGRQLLMVFEAVHDGLDRTMQDLHPHEVVWNKDKNKLTVYDFNVLGGDPDSQGGEVYKSVRSDIYLASQVLYRLLTGSSFNPSRPPIPQLVRIKDPSQRLVLAQAFHPDSSKRFQTAKEFRLALEEVIKNE